MFFSKSIPISKSSFDHKKSMAKNQNPGRNKEGLPGRNFERRTKKDRNSKPNSSRKFRQGNENHNAKEQEEAKEISQGARLRLGLHIPPTAVKMRCRS
jgi:hypothetical protein